MNNKVNRILIGIIIVSIIILVILDNTEEKKSENTNTLENTVFKEVIITDENDNKIDNSLIVEKTEKKAPKEVEKVDKIKLQDVDGNKTDYTFEYRNEKYNAQYTKDNWHIEDSYRIRDKYDIEQICKALIAAHKIHGKDRVSYRTAEDMAYEWIQHNLAYDILPEDSPWKENVKNVDLDPDDQGKSLYELYSSRINESEK